MQMVLARALDADQVVDVQALTIVRTQNYIVSQRETMFTSRPIGFARTDYKTTSDIPRGLGTKHYDTAVLELLPEFEAGLTDIEGFSHLYVIWEFDRSEGFELMGTPPSDDRPHGVFATRSPQRPNPIALTVVTLMQRDGLNLYVRGPDMVDRTPILDIKPYLSSVPAQILRRGWLAEAEARSGRAAAGIDEAADTLPDEIYLCTFDELFERLSPPQRNPHFARLTTLVQKLGYQIASGRDPNFHEVWALSPRVMSEPKAHLRTFQPNVPEPPPPAKTTCRLPVNVLH